MDDDRGGWDRAGEANRGTCGVGNHQLILHVAVYFDVLAEGSFAWQIVFDEIFKSLGAVGCVSSGECAGVGTDVSAYYVGGSSWPCVTFVVFVVCPFLGFVESFFDDPVPNGGGAGNPRNCSTHFCIIIISYPAYSENLAGVAYGPIVPAVIGGSCLY